MRISKKGRIMRPKTLSLVFGIFLAATACSTTPPAPDPTPQWETIFDGATLEGWTPKLTGQALGNDADTVFRVEDGILIAAHKSDAPFNNAFGHLFYADPLSDYRLRFDYKFFGTQAAEAPAWAFMNSGVMVHAQAPESMGLNQGFPISVEAQLLSASKPDSSRTTANVCTPGTDVTIDGAVAATHCVNSKMPATMAGEWVAFEVEVRSDAVVRLSIDGTEAFRLTRPTYDTGDGDVSRLGLSGPITSGYFALQAESHPVAFRKIELMRLSASDPIGE